MVIEIVRKHDDTWEGLHSYAYPNNAHVHLPEVGDRVFAGKEFGLRTVTEREFTFMNFDPTNPQDQTVRIYVADPPEIAALRLLAHAPDFADEATLAQYEAPDPE